MLFVCQEQTRRDKFLAAADRDLTGHLWHPAVAPSEKQYPGRRRILFACEADVHAGILEALRVPGYPPRHPGRRGALAETRRVRLPGPTAAWAERETEPARPNQPAATTDPQQTLETA